MMTMLRIGTVLLILVVAQNGYSSPPPPTPPETSPIPPSHPKNSQGSATADPRSTEQTPRITKDVKAPTIQEELKDHETKAPTDQWLMYFTGGLVGVGFLQLIVFGLQARRLRQTIDEMKIATKATEKAATAAERSAEIARHEFIATHRPKIIVRQFSIDKVGDDGESVDIGYEMVNTGESLATVVCSSLKLWWHSPAKPLPAIPPYAESIVQSTPLESGSPVTAPSQHVPDFAFVEGFEEGSEATATGDHLFALGYIDYKDTIGKTRRTAFLRRYDFTAKRFDAIHHTEYEYQD